MSSKRVAFKTLHTKSSLTFFISSICSRTFACAVVKIHSHIACTGDTVTLPCGSAGNWSHSVDWDYQRRPNATAVKLIVGGYLTNGDRDSRLSTDGSALIIAYANPAEDNGLYTCTTDSGHGTRYRINLTVLGKLSGHFLSYELLRWLVQMPSRDVYHYRMINASRSTVCHYNDKRSRDRLSL